MGDETAEHLPERMQPVLEPGRNAEIAAPSTQHPEQVWIALGCHGEHVAPCRHQLDRQQVVHGEAVHTIQPAEPAAERESSDAGGGDDPAGCGKTTKSSLPVQLAPCDAALC